MSIMCVLSACAVGPNFVRPMGPGTQHYQSGQEPSQTMTTVGGAQHFEYGGQIAADWWRLFDCPKLDAMVLAAITSNRRCKLRRRRYGRAKTT